VSFRQACVKDYGTPPYNFREGMFHGGFIGPFKTGLIHHGNRFLNFPE
jgi:hypothetical protein